MQSLYRSLNRAFQCRTFYAEILQRNLTMQRNIEIKATVKNPVELENRVETLASGDPSVFDQEDVFFKVTDGRLKMRYQTGMSPQLIFYQRKNTHGPKLSNFKIVRQSEESAKDMEALLGMAVGCLGRVKKQRKVYMVGQTRIHLDNVQHLGHFLEFEVVLREDQSVTEGEEIASKLSQVLDISPEHFIDCAYMDLLLNVNTPKT